MRTTGWPEWLISIMAPLLDISIKSRNVVSQVISFLILTISGNLSQMVKYITQ